MFSAENATEAHKMTLSHILKNGFKASYGNSLSIGAQRSTIELENFQFSIINPRNRAVGISSVFSIQQALARTYWLVSASNKVEDIVHYIPAAKRFSDDGQTIPGSNFGYRVLSRYPEKNLIKAAIDLLKEEPWTRRAVVPIYLPEDVGRQSHDIPCAIAATFRIVDNRLNMTTLMRSNNCVKILPYNIFEFTFLQEIVATELNISMGKYTHFANSMHAYEDEIELVNTDVPPSKNISVPSEFDLGLMPPNPFGKICDLVEQEKVTRQIILEKRYIEFENQIRKSCEILENYWGVFFCSLVSLIINNQNDKYFIDCGNEFVGIQLTELLSDSESIDALLGQKR